jgi:hypothetical protein
MSRLWTRAKLEESCGHCRRRIAVGAPMLVITVPPVNKGFKRCSELECAGEPVPDDLPATIIAPRPEPVSLERLGLLALDFRRDREPGEEG